MVEIKLLLKYATAAKSRIAKRLIATRLGSEEKEEKGHDVEKRKLKSSALFHHHIDVDVFKYYFNVLFYF
jgi:hypothetical protein